MQDFLKRNLEIGDSVIFITPGYRQYTLGRVLDFAKSKIRVLTGTDWRGEARTLLQSPEQLVKVDGPALTMYLLLKD